MNKQTIQTLTPLDASSAAISAALDRAHAERTKTEKRRAEAAAQLAAGIATLTSAERRTLNDAIEDSDFDLKQLETIALDLGQRLTAVRIAEDHERASARRAEIVRRKAESESEFEANFEKLLAPVRKMLADRKLKLDELNEFNETDGSRFADLFIPGAPEFYSPVNNTKLPRSAAEIAAEQKRLDDLAAHNQRIMDEVRHNKFKQFEEMQIAASKIQYDLNSSCVFINGVKQQRGELWKR